VDTVIEQPAFSLVDNDEVLSAAEAEDRMCNIISDEKLAAKFFDEFGKIDTGLQVLILVVNPGLRERLWDTIDDRVKFWFVVYDRPLPCDRTTLIRDIVHDVVRELYRDPMDGCGVT
jgi:hypothetical protein